MRRRRLSPAVQKHRNTFNSWEVCLDSSANKEEEEEEEEKTPKEEVFSLRISSVDRQRSVPDI